MFPVIYKNKRYQVEVDVEAQASPYLIRNIGTTVVDGRADDMPSALLQATQMNFLLEDEFHLKVEEDLKSSRGHVSMTGSGDVLPFKH